MNTLKWVYDYLNYNPHIGMISAIYSYILGVRGVMLNDQTLKEISIVSAVAGCLVACMTAASLLIRGIVGTIKLIKYLKIKYRNKS
jgi:hypothetical protein